MAMLRLLGARGARGVHGAANEAFTASAERALMYSKLHRSSAHAPALEACARLKADARARGVQGRVKLGATDAAEGLRQLFVAVLAVAQP